jgi:hypothetical protein
MPYCEKWSKNGEKNKNETKKMRKDIQKKVKIEKYIPENSRKKLCENVEIPYNKRPENETYI